MSETLKVPFEKLQAKFGDKLQENCRMANYTTVRIGGRATALLPVNSEKELADAALILWDLDVPFKVIGSGSNILVSDQGYAGVILLNRAHNIKINSKDETPTVQAESGANLGTVARQTALRGFSGMEWAASIPGTVGGAVYGNAGAHGSDINSNLIMATILHPISGIEHWTAGQMSYQYRSSILKREKSNAVILSALFKVQKSTQEEAWEKINEYSERRQSTQPSGASSGSTFKNPPGDYAGRLIEAVRLKGERKGDAQISPVHANFIVNTGKASAADYSYLIKLAQSRVLEQFNVRLELEIELIGEFNDKQ
jgi:UDP-N-acetylmuramate dehydrogenase